MDNQQALEFDELPVIMSIDRSSRGLLGCAYYIGHEARMLCMEDVEMGEADVVESLLLQVQPTAIIIAPRLEEAFQNIGSGTSTALFLSDSSSPPYELLRRPPSEFNYESALKQLAQSQYQNEQVMRFMIPGAGINLDDLDDIDLNGDAGRLIHASAHLDLASKISVSCVGAILSYIRRKSPNNVLQQSIHFEMFTIKDTMLVNSDTLASLQIINSEHHPNAAKQGPGCSGAKEASVYGLFYHLARTSQGRARLRQMFLRPSLDIGTIITRLDFITLCSNAENCLISERVSRSLAKVKDLRGVLSNLRKGVEGTTRPSKIRSSVWSTLIEFCYHVIGIQDELAQMSGLEQLPIFEQVRGVFNRNQLAMVGRLIQDTVNLDDSAEQQRTVIQRGVNTSLDQVKDLYDGMGGVLSRVARELAISLPGDIEINVIFYPQLGFHILMPLDPATGQHHDFPAPDWQRRFTTQHHAYIKNNKMREMDADLGDLWSQICDNEIEIAYELAQKVLHHEEMLLATSSLCGELDCMLALVHGAIQYQLVRPELSQESIIDITGGRHILQELTVPSFIPNDTMIVGGSQQGPSMLILTGPNYSGKSVYQKQVALIAYMGQVGSFVPAKAATIGITDKIMTRISTRESVTRTQSAFLIDLQQISRAINCCTERSLLIIDEFGKGTDICDGAALAAATFEHLVSKGAKCPKIVASTHFHEIFEHLHIEDSRKVMFMSMQVMVNDQGESGCDIVHLYHLVKGRSTLSYGTQCAAMSGIPSTIVARANKLAELVAYGEDLTIACTGNSDVEELEEAEKIAREFLSQDFSQSAGAEQVMGMRATHSEC